jgi:hypothetical protein
VGQCLDTSAQGTSVRGEVSNPTDARAPALLIWQLKSINVIPAKTGIQWRAKRADIDSCWMAVPRNSLQAARLAASSKLAASGSFSGSSPE